MYVCVYRVNHRSGRAVNGQTVKRNGLSVVYYVLVERIVESFEIMASKSKSVVNQSLRELDMSVNKELIKNIKLHPSLWYTVKYTQKDEIHWNSMSAEMGIQSKRSEAVEETKRRLILFALFAESWLKRRWQQLRTEFNNSQLHHPALAKHLTFLKKTTTRATGSKVKDDHHEEDADEFHITQEQLDESLDETSSTDLNTINFDADNESTEGFAEYEFTIVTDADDLKRKNTNRSRSRAITMEKVEEDESSASECATSAVLKKNILPIALMESPSSEVNEVEYQDKVFGDLVSAMLSNMSPEKKKQAKKEIMNILL